MDFEKFSQYESEDYATASVKLGDLNNDGFLDIVNGNSDEVNYVYINSKGETFEKFALNPENKMDTYDILLALVNRDNYLDIIEANSDELNLYYLNRFERLKKRK